MRRSAAILTALAAALLALLAFLPSSASAAPLPPYLAGTDWTRIPTQHKVVALTFDAGANADGMPSILATLRRTGVPATFFLTGRWVTAYPGFTRTLGRQGYALGNHTTTHPHVPTLTDRQLAHELASTEHAVREATGRSTKPFFRFPFGDRRASDIGRVNALGYAAIAWTVDTAGWLGTSGGMSVSSVLDRVRAARQPGQIVLMHVGSNPTDGSTLDADALPRMIRQFRHLGYSFTTVHALLRH